KRPAVLVIVKNPMPLRECPASGVLARESDPRALYRQRCEGERFGVGPVQRRLLPSDLQTRFEKFFYLRMRLKAVRQNGLLLEKRFQFFLLHRRLDFVFWLRSAEIACPNTARFIELWRLIFRGG